VKIHVLQSQQLSHCEGGTWKLECDLMHVLRRDTMMSTIGTDGWESALCRGAIGLAATKTVTNVLARTLHSQARPSLLDENNTYCEWTSQNDG
jgi:hypothetical protein